MAMRSLLLTLLLLAGPCGSQSATAHQHDADALAEALTLARADVLAHVRSVEAQVNKIQHPARPGSLGHYLLDNKVFEKTAIFGLFNTTFLNTDVVNGTDKDFELVFQATGCNSHTGCVPLNSAQSDGVDDDMWLRDSGAQMHYYVANGLAASSPPLTRVIQALLREHARYVLLDSYANSFTAAPFQSSTRWMRRGGVVNTGNYEPDGWCWSVFLAHALYKSGAQPPDGAPPLFDFSFKLALEKMLIQVGIAQGATYGAVPTHPTVGYYWCFC